jgi:hypothetical protein
VLTFGGYRENITMSQIQVSALDWSVAIIFHFPDSGQVNLTMDSHEEKLHKMIEQSKVRQWHFALLPCLAWVFEGSWRS